MNYKAVAALAFTSMFSISTLLSPAYAEEQEKALNFGIISTESQQNLKPQWEPFLKDMETKLGIKVNAFFAPDYAGIIQGMRFNKVDIAWYGNLSAMEAVDRANGQVFAQTVAADGSPGYWSVLIVNKDSPINNLNDMLAKRKELTFGNGDPNSTSGFLVPGYYVFAMQILHLGGKSRCIQCRKCGFCSPNTGTFSLDAQIGRASCRERV